MAQKSLQLVQDVAKMQQLGHDLQTSYEFDKVLSEHTNMMDCRKTKKPYSEEKIAKESMFENKTERRYAFDCCLIYFCC